MQCVELFCGPGSFSAGAAPWGMVPVLAVDSDETALDIFQHNFSDDDTCTASLFLGDPSNDAHLIELVQKTIDHNVPWHLHASPPRHLVRWTMGMINNLNPPSWSVIVKSNRATKQALANHQPRRWVCGKDSYLYAGTVDVSYVARMVSVTSIDQFRCSYRNLPNVVLATKGFPDWFELPNLEGISNPQIARVLIGAIYPKCGEIIALSAAAAFREDDALDEACTTDVDDADDDEYEFVD